MLDAAEYRDIVRRALQEDVRDGDITTDATVDAALRARGVFLAKADCVVAGLDVAIETFRQLDSTIRATTLKRDGDACRAGEEIAEVVGTARALLVGERTALNFLQRLCGIATRARRFVEAGGGRITILDTRKTTPTLRALEKYAVRAGGAANHRAGLFDAVLIKENHIHLAGGVRQAVERCRSRNPAVPIEVEAETLTPFYGADCPVAVVVRASWADQRILRGTLGDIGARVAAEAIERTAIVLVGRALAAEDFRESALYDRDYQRRFRGGAS